jgi:hypothetical protein
MKAEFDTYRAAGRPHPLFESAGIDAVPFVHAELDRWRHNFTGVRWKDEATGWTLFGAIDDLWLAASGELIVADYKATARAEVPTTGRLYPSYQRQMDVYQFLVRRQGFEVSNRGWFVYANGDARIGLFDGVLRFSTTMVPYDGDDAWVLDAFRRAVTTVLAPGIPAPGEDCNYCNYVARATAADATPPDAQDSGASR